MLSESELTVDFCRVVPRRRKGSLDFGTAIGKLLNERATAEERNLVVADGIERMMRVNDHLGVIEGVFVRTRTSRRKVISVTADDLHDLALAPGEQIAALCCFVFYPEYDVLVTGRNREVGSANRIVSYLNNLVAAGLDTGAILSRHGVEDMERFRIITRAEVKIALPPQLSFWDRNADVVGAVFDRFREFGPLEVTVALGMGRVGGRHKTGLASGKLREWFLALLSNPRDLKKIELKGYPGVGELADVIEFDLLRDRLGWVETMSADPTIDEITAVLNAAYVVAEPEIAEQIASKIV